MAREISITIKPTKEVLREFAIALGKSMKGERIKTRDEISFESVKAFRNFLTKRRLELMHVIKSKKPKSVYELSKMTGRDIKSVVTDLSLLKKQRLVALKKEKGGRNSVVPKVLFDRINIGVEV